jgi:type IV secretory pathway VirB4 component
MELDEFGKRVWKHKTNKRMFLEQAYHWKKTMILLEEFEEERNVVMCLDIETTNLDSWVPMTKKEFESVKRCYKEIYN